MTKLNHLFERFGVPIVGVALGISIFLMIDFVFYVFGVVTLHGVQ